jgi:hypothetical protein
MANDQFENEGKGRFLDEMTRELFANFRDRTLALVDKLRGSTRYVKVKDSRDGGY